MPAEQGPNAAGSNTASGPWVSINDIPEELLISIFELSLQVKPMNRPSTLCRLRLTCRWWEQVIQRTPSLWSNVCSLHGPKWTELALRRSSPYPLTVEVTGLSSRAAIVTVVRELHRTEALSVILPFRRNVYQSPALTHLHQPAPPTLKSLSLSFLGLDRPDQLIFNGQWTHIRSLQVVEVDVDWDACKFSRLERLEIGGTDSPPNLVQLLHIFGCCQDLVHVRLWGVDLRVGPSLPSASSGVITLPKLTTFVVSCDIGPLVEILGKVKMPNCQHFEFHEQGSRGPGPASLSHLLDTLMPFVEMRSVQHHNATNSALYFSAQRELVLRCQLSSHSAAGIQFTLHIQDMGKDEELQTFEKSNFWSVFEGSGLIIKEAELKYGTHVPIGAGDFL